MDLLSNIHFRKPSDRIGQFDGQLGLNFPIRNNVCAHIHTHIHSQVIHLTRPWAFRETTFQPGRQFPFHCTNIMLHYTKTQHSPICQVNKERSLKFTVTFTKLSISTLNECAVHQSASPAWGQLFLWLRLKWSSTGSISSSWLVPGFNAMPLAGTVTAAHLKLPSYTPPHWQGHAALPPILFCGFFDHQKEFWATVLSKSSYSQNGIPEAAGFLHIPSEAELVQRPLKGLLKNPTAGCPKITHHDLGSWLNATAHLKFPHANTWSVSWLSKMSYGAKNNPPIPSSSCHPHLSDPLWSSKGIRDSSLLARMWANACIYLLFTNCCHSRWHF